MSYELEHVEKECLCPCGKGRIVYGWGTNDWNQVREGMIEIWCSDCSEKYKLSKGGLLPKEFPEYEGDKDAYNEMYKLRDIVNNYQGYYGIRFWPDELIEKRRQLYLTQDEIKEDQNNNLERNFAMALGFSKKLADDFSLEELKEVQRQLTESKYSTQLVGNAKDIAERYKRTYKTIKVSKVIIPVNMAVRNYKAYKESDKEDKRYIQNAKKLLKMAQSIYYKDFEQYEKNRKSQLIPFELRDVRSCND